MFIIIIISFIINYFIKYDVLICRSKEGNIILVYDNNELVNFGTTRNMSFNFINQNSYVEKIGIESYINSFKNSFENNTNGKCNIIK